MMLSIPLSIHNRSSLLRRALESYLWQSLPPAEWEVLLIDDGSTENLSEAYEAFLGKINLRHVFFDHTRHERFRRRNPAFKRGDPEDWFKTPALTTNAGSYLARAPFVGLFHPEVLHAPDNFRRAVDQLKAKEAYLFGKVWLGDRLMNRWLESHSSWTQGGWEAFLSDSSADRLRAFSPSELYWYCSFLPRRAVQAVGGVDFEYLDGNSYEDCDFRDRIVRKGFPSVFDPLIQGLHMDHSSETEAHRIRDSRWYESERRNELLYRNRDFGLWTGSPANSSADWTARECIVQIVEYGIGSRKCVSVLQGSGILA